jgi:hypothetical protein
VVVVIIITVMHRIHGNCAGESSAAESTGIVEYGMGTIEFGANMIEHEIEPEILAVWDTDDEFGATTWKTNKDMKEKDKRTEARKRTPFSESNLSPVCQELTFQWPMLLSFGKVNGYFR